MGKLSKKQKWVIGVSSVLVALLCISGGVGVYFAIKPSQQSQPLPPHNNDSNQGQTPDSPNTQPQVPQPPQKPNPPKPSPSPTPKPPQPQPQPEPDPPPPIDSLDSNMSMHTLPLSLMLNAQSPLDIIQASSLFQASVKQMQQALKSYDWKNNGLDEEFDGMYLTWGGNENVYNNFFRLNQEVGIFGEYGQDLKQKMVYSPKKIAVNYDMQQKYLPANTSQVQNPIDLSHESQVLTSLNTLIQSNQFGYLPSNLSQFLYYLDLTSVQQVFHLSQPVTKITMDFNDQVGSAQIYLYTSSNQVYQVSLTKQNSALKNEADFENYIFDRTFIFHTPSLYKTKVVTSPINAQNNKVRISSEPGQGTGWIIDRIINPTLEQNNQYEFLVGTNMHVLDVSSSYNKDRDKATGASRWTIGIPSYRPTITEATYNQFWDGGARSLHTKWNSTDIDGPIKLEPAVAKQYVQHDVIQERKPQGKSVYTINKSAHKNTTDAQNDSQSPNLPLTPINFDSTNYLDLVWYTPSFSTQGSYTDTDGAKSYPVFDPSPAAYEQNDLQAGLTKYNNHFIGNISNAGADFVISKIILTKDQIHDMFPSLYPLLGTDQEADWYIGLGPNNHASVPSANSTLFVGGYPDNSWRSIKSSSGKICSQPRYISNESNNYQTYWTKYDALVNQQCNTYRGLVEWYATNHAVSPSMTPSQNQTYLPHGMQIQKVLLQSLISYDLDNADNSIDAWLAHGSSGSMIINSRFELVGVHHRLFVYNQPGNSDQIDDHSYFNMGLLMNNYTQENHAKFNIPNQVIQKLQAENTHTLKLNPINK